MILLQFASTLPSMSVPTSNIIYPHVTVHVALFILYVQGVPLQYSCNNVSLDFVIWTRIQALYLQL